MQAQALNLSLRSDENPMQNKLFVAGIPYSLTEQEMSDAFTPHGSVVSAKIISDRETGKSRGFGFVEMSNDDEAEAAIQALDNTNLGGRTINVSVARPMEKREPRKEGRREDRGDRRDY